MKPLKDNINEWIKLYLNDLEDYGESNEFLLAEQTLRGFSKLLVESNQDASLLLHETIAKSDEKQRKIYEEFLEYLENT